MEKHKRRPDPEQKSEDQKELENFKVEVMDALKVDQEFLSDYFVTYVIFMLYIFYVCNPSIAILCLRLL